MEGLNPMELFHGPANRGPRPFTRERALELNSRSSPARGVLERVRIVEQFRSTLIYHIYPFYFVPSFLFGFLAFLIAF